MKDLQQLITSKTLIETTLPGAKELDFLLREKIKIKSHKPMAIFYGETFDQHGMTLDSLKYYFFISAIHSAFKSFNAPIVSTILQADSASLLNKSSHDKRKILEKALKTRLKMLTRIKKIYSLPFSVQLMSDVHRTSLYKQNIERVDEYINSDKRTKRFFDLIKKTVLRNKLNQEEKTRYKYALEAIATSLYFDIKVGPLREQFYDKALQFLTKKNYSSLISLYLRPSYPLGQNFAYFLSNQEIEKYGVTPYKAGSNKLQDSRIILGVTPLNRAAELIKSSFDSLNPKTVHPVYEVFVITELAEHFISNETLDIQPLRSFSSVEELKRMTIERLERFIYKPLGLM